MLKMLLLLGMLFLSACNASVTATSTPVITPPTTGPLAVSKTLIVAHRGGAALAPENTLGAFANALKLGVDMVECDVHLSKDGALVVMHDPVVSRTTDGNGVISELTLAEIKKLNAAAKFAGGFAAQQVPTLAQVLDLVKGQAGIQIEIKTMANGTRYSGIEKQVVDLVNARGMTNEVIIISFDFPTLQEIKRIEPRLKTGALVNAAWLSARAHAAPEQIVADALDPTGADFYMPAFVGVNERIVQAVHARGRKIGAWTVNNTSDMKRLAGWGVDALTSDKPDELKNVLSR